MILHGRNGNAVGTFVAPWLFDEHGQAVARIHDTYLYRPDGNGPIGTWTADVLYDKGGAPIAIGENPKLRMAASIQPRVNPMPERLLPDGESVFEAGPICLREPFDTFALAHSLVEFGVEQ